MPTGVLLVWALAGWAGQPTRFALPAGCAPRACVYLASSEPARAVPNPVQAEAIRTPERAVLVLASAGTGKTRVLRTRMAWLLLRQKVPSRNILAVTFSQHAALQLQARVAAVAGNAGDGAWLGTFHSVCWRMLRENHRYLSLPPDFTVAAEADQMRLIDEVYTARVQSRAVSRGGESEQGLGGTALDRSGFGGAGASSGAASGTSGTLSAVERLVAAAGIDPVSAPGAGGAPSRPERRGLSRQRAAEVLHFILNWKERGITPEDLAHGHAPRSRFGADSLPPDAPPAPREPSDAEALARSLYPGYQLALRAHGMLDFSDLTLTTLRLFERHPSVLDGYRRQFRHVLVDELQDTSRVQFEWLRRLAGMPAGGAQGEGRGGGEGLRGGEGLGGGEGRNGGEGQASARCAGLLPAVFCVADDDQSVYGWRGAERANVLRFTAEFEGVTTIRMTTSYRCAPHALAAAQVTEGGVGGVGHGGAGCEGRLREGK
jgi:superfamily I DNA/RNA helicase